MNAKMYSSERNVQILLALFKAHGVRKMVISPGSANVSFVASVQFDKDFELYSSVDERSAAYIACGLAEEAGEPVVICCTGATASRNYMPGLTEAYYRKLPIIAVTATKPIAWIGQNTDQLIDRTVIPNDIAVKSVHLPIVKTKEDEMECNLKINTALLEMRRNGNGPVHINLTTAYSIDFSQDRLCDERIIRRYYSTDDLPKIEATNVAIFVGAHSAWNEKLLSVVDLFCEKYNAVVLYDQTSNYKGKYGISLGLFLIAGFPEISIDLLIHIGNISASWSKIPKNTWRVNADGEIRDTFKCLTKVFEMEETLFFERYANMLPTREYNISHFKKWRKEYERIRDILKGHESDIPFSSLWIAHEMHDKIPKNSVMHFGILNSLRCWNCYEVDKSIRGYSNTGGFGIDGGVSSLIGASLHKKDTIYFGIFGDLAFFYDMNSLGNRHIGANIRIIVANNGLGGEFKNNLGNTQKAGLGDKANDYISAYGHYGQKSLALVKHFAEDLGFRYYSANDKLSFKEAMKEFLSPKLSTQPMLLEVFLDDHEDVSAISFIQSLGSAHKSGGGFERKVKDLVKATLGEKAVKTLKGRG